MKMLDGSHVEKKVTCLQDQYVQYNFKKSLSFRKSLMKLGVKVN